ncbi:hypothetical protein [Pseudomonas proteolytica]|uniref:hypothetical protein n=1 Tax=Pseudomonas proteolytica TaxID=219574 RepID=UPI0030DBF606
MTQSFGVALCVLRKIIDTQLARYVKRRLGALHSGLTQMNLTQHSKCNESNGNAMGSAFRLAKANIKGGWRMSKRQKIAGILDAAYERMPAITKWVGWPGLMFGPVLGFFHIVAMVLMPGAYGKRVLAQYDLVQLTGSLLVAPLAQYLMILGFTLCVLWIGLWGLRLVLAVRWWLVRRSV